MIRPKRMKRLELTVLSRDVDRVIEHLGCRAIMHVARDESGPHRLEEKKGESALVRIKAVLDRIQTKAAFLSIELPQETDSAARLPTEDDTRSAQAIADRIGSAADAELELNREQKSVQDALGEAKAFANLNAPFSDLDQLSYLTLRVGRLDLKKIPLINAGISDRAVIVPLGDGDRVVAASSRKGRFALDTELKKAGFIPLAIPEGFKGVPSELLSGLEAQAAELEQKIKALELEKKGLGEEYGPILGRLCSSFRMAVAVEELKGHLIATHSFYSLSGWVAAEEVKNLISDLERLTDGRIALRSFDPEEIPAVREGSEKVPVSLEHGAFVKSFEPLVFSYGAPLYGTIDPTLFVALSFTVLFGIMFGDVGQGFVLFLLGYFVGRKKSGFLTNFKRFAIPLRAVGAASMAVGFLDGEVFSNEELLIRPTRAITGFFTGVPVDRILQLMPEKGSLDKLFLFFAFTIGVGVVINSIGLVINIINQASLGRWEKALFAKTGLAGALLFWYTLFMGVRIALGGTFAWFDILGISSTALALFVGPALWRLITGKRPILEHGPLVFFMEGFVELLETASSYISNTVSFLRVGAFALSHAVLSFIVFSLSEMVSAQPFGGPFFALIVVVFGNAVIILLEGMIVAIQVIRLQYYEFFSKFFTETGVEFSPFRFRREA